MKRTRSIILIAILLLSTMVMFVTPTVANGVANVWVVTENPTRYSNADGPYVGETVIKDVIMGATYTDAVLVLCKTGGEADDINLYFLVSESDKQCIANITIGKAWIVNSSGSSENVAGQTPEAIQQAEFTFINNDGEDRDGWGDSYYIGDLPQLDNPDDIGNVDDMSTFYPGSANPHIRVPFTITFAETPPEGFMLYFYAENPDTGVHMVWSHDCGFYNIPEFATIAIPAIALLGLFAFYRRKQKK